MNHFRDGLADPGRQGSSAAVDRRRVPGSERLRYSVRDFADDRVRLISTRAPGREFGPAFLDVIDGRMVIVRQPASPVAWPVDVEPRTGAMELR